MKSVLAGANHFFDAFNDITNTDVHKMMNSLGSPTKLDDQGGASAADLRKMLKQLNEQAEGLLDALKFILGEDDFNYLAGGRHSTGENALVALKQVLMGLVTGGIMGKLGSTSIAMAMIPGKISGGYAELLMGAWLKSEGIKITDNQLSIQLGNLGRRVIDFESNNLVFEVKSGVQELSKVLEKQIMKDVGLMNSGRQVEWHFWKNPITLEGGPSQNLLYQLKLAGIKVVQH